MIDYALASLAWTTTGQTGFCHQGELWRALLGLDQLSRWRVEQTALAESLRPRWASWARVYIGNARNADALAGFLARPAAGGMVLEGLQWLARPATYRQPMLRYWDDVADLLFALGSCLVMPYGRIPPPSKPSSSCWGYSLPGSTRWVYS